MNDGLAPIEVRIEKGEGGHLVVVKSGSGELSARKLSREAEVLELSRHPCVADLIDVTSEGDRCTLRTRWIGSQNLTQARPTGADAITGVVAALANTVAELHARGVTHNRIDREHVVIDAAGAPVLCGFSEARHEASRATPTGEFREATAEDVAAIGRLMEEMIGDQSIPGTRKLLKLAQIATDPDPMRRPTARALADAVTRCTDTSPRRADTRRAQRTSRRHTTRLDSAKQHLVRSRGKESRIDGFHREGSRSDRVRVASTDTKRRILPIVVPTACALLACAAWLSVSHTTSGVTMVSSETIPPAKPTTMVDEATREEVPVIEHGGASYRIGLPGDRVLVGDWSCSDSPTAIVVRPSTREIFLFDSWAQDGSPVEVTPVSHVPTGIDPSSVSADPTRCGVLRMTRPDGTEVALTLSPPNGR